MNNYFYQVEDGQFSFNFESPLLGNIGDTIYLYDAVENEFGKLEVEVCSEFKINDITRYDIMDNDGIQGIVSCSGTINDDC